ncbi:MAG: flavin reductase [Oscillospiraceae bacterium]|nr:flavin reductase [Oscillospiraceae bacterium]
MKISEDVFSWFGKKWALLTAGTKESFNTMTISWGGMGTLWGKPVVTVYVKPIRYTWQFMEKSDVFTVSFYSEDFRQDLTLLGELSGRDGDKISRTKLTPAFLAEGVSFREAEITLVCKKIYAQDLDRGAMPENVRNTIYATEAPHRMYVGEVVGVVRPEA